MIYKTILHVKVLHEYFLSGQKDETIFSIPVQQDRMNYLMNKMALDQPSASNLLEFEFPESLKKMYRDQHIRLLPTYSGFKLAIEVNASQLPDGTTVYTPKIPLQEDFSISVLARKKRLWMRSPIHALLKPIPAIYYFSNENMPAAKAFRSAAILLQHSTQVKYTSRVNWLPLAPMISAHFIQTAADHNGEPLAEPVS